MIGTTAGVDGVRPHHTSHIEIVPPQQMPKGIWLKTWKLDTRGLVQRFIKGHESADPNEAAILKEVERSTFGQKAEQLKDRLAPTRHGYIVFDGFCFQGFAQDRETGKRLATNDRPNEKLAVFVVPWRESERMRFTNKHNPGPDQEILLDGASRVHAFAALLDVGAAINAAHLIYKAYDIQHFQPTDNSNAVCGALLATLNKCRPEACLWMLGAETPHSFPGYNDGLLRKLDKDNIRIGTVYKDLADKGASIPDLATAFTDPTTISLLENRLQEQSGWMAQLPAPIERQALAFKP